MPSSTAKKAIQLRDALAASLARRPTTFRIREPLESPRTVRLATRSQELRTSSGNESSMLEFARTMLAADELYEVVPTIGRDARCPLAIGTVVLSCEVETC